MRLKAKALKLSAAERTYLADKMWLSLETQSEINAAWAKEISNRIRDVDSGAVETIPHEDVVAELRARYGRLTFGNAISN